MHKDFASARTVEKALADYTALCRQEERFPNLAGFARHLGVSLEELTAWESTREELYARICTVLEDEALNSGMQATLLSAYMKQRLGYGTADGKDAPTRHEAVHVLFAHDMGEDGK